MADFELTQLLGDDTPPDQGLQKLHSEIARRAKLRRRAGVGVTVLAAVLMVSLFWSKPPPALDYPTTGPAIQGQHDTTVRGLRVVDGVVLGDFHNHQAVDQLPRTQE